MDEHDDQDCNTTLELGLNQYYSPIKDNPRVSLLELSIPDHPRDVESSKSFGEDEGERRKEDSDCSNFSKNRCRKKLKLSSDQTTLLEHTFKHHSILNTAQKLALAEKLSLEPRQVEVWFQNRRARRKLKQTEIECNLLKKKCERLKEENRRLRRELIELTSAVKIRPPEVAAEAVMGSFHEPQRRSAERNVVIL